MTTQVKFPNHVEQRWAIILPLGSNWILDLDELASQVVRENNPPNKDQIYAICYIY